MSELSEMKQIYEDNRVRYRNAVKQQIIENKSYDLLHEYMVLLGWQGNIFTIEYEGGQKNLDPYLPQMISIYLHTHWQDPRFGTYFNHTIVEIEDVLSNASGMVVTLIGNSIPIANFYSIVYETNEPH
jgi:hypothetical protein